MKTRFALVAAGLAMNIDIVAAGFIVPSSGAVIANMERRYLYEDYDNKIEVFVPHEDNSKLFMEVEDAVVKREKNYFIVNPHGGWTRRYIYVKKKGPHGDTVDVYNELFDVVSIPDPTLYVAGHDDSINVRMVYSPYPLLSYKMGRYQTNEFLTYEILKFDVDLIADGKITTVHCRNSTGNRQLKMTAGLAKEGDKLRYYNIVAAFPDGSVRDVPEKTFYVYREPGQ